MKGGVSSSYAIPVPAKRRWRGPVIAVLALVFLSMLLPLVFLLGLHNGFHSTTGYGTDHRNSAPTRIKIYDQHITADTTNQSKVYDTVAYLVTVPGSVIASFKILDVGVIPS